MIAEAVVDRFGCADGKSLASFPRLPLRPKCAACNAATGNGSDAGAEETVVGASEVPLFSRFPSDLRLLLMCAGRGGTGTAGCVASLSAGSAEGGGIEAYEDAGV